MRKSTTEGIPSSDRIFNFTAPNDEFLGNAVDNSTVDDSRITEFKKDIETSSNINL